MAAIGGRAPQVDVPVLEPSPIPETPEAKPDPPKIAAPPLLSPPPKPLPPPPKPVERARQIRATPFKWIDPKDVPRRKILYPNFIREFISVTISLGGIGKSSLLLTESLAMATAKPLLGYKPEAPLRVWYLNAEDPRDELDRRIAAICKHYSITAADIGDRLFVDSGRTQPFVIAQDSRFAVKIAELLVADAIATIKENQIDVFVIDPFVRIHEVSENDNIRISKVVGELSWIAEKTGCAVHVVHHSRKLGGAAATVDDARGASALLAAARVGRSINTMTTEEAERAEIQERFRRYFFRADIGKANLSPPPEAADWFRLVSVDLDPEVMSTFDHSVGVVTPYAYPAPKTLRVTAGDIVRAQAAIAGGGPWRENSQATTEPWVGEPIGRTLGLGTSKPDRRAIRILIRDWLALGYLTRVMRQDEQRHSRDYIEAGDAPLETSDAAKRAEDE
jgi:hypothetical protein